MGWLSDTWESVKENASDICHGVLDVAGFIPVLGAVPDLLNAGIYALEGNALDAGMSLVAAVPGVGDIGAAVGKGGKYLFKGGKWLLGKGKKLFKGGGKLLKALKKSKFLGKLGGWILGKIETGAKWIKKGKEYFNKATKKIKEMLKKTHCFVEDTLIWTKDGLVEIQKIKSGDLIYAKNEKTGEVGLKKVKKTVIGQSHTIYRIGIGDYDIIQTTNYHRFYVEERGWVCAIQLQKGDQLCTMEGKHIEITSIEKERREEGKAVYNFVVEDWESYFVSEVGIYVHNDRCKPPLENGPYIKDGKPHGRPGPTGKDKAKFEQDVYDKCVDPDGVLRDPNTKDVIDWKPGQSRKGVVDFGHTEGNTYKKMFEKYKNREISLDELKEFQKNPDNFRLETPSANRSHKYE